MSSRYWMQVNVYADILRVRVVISFLVLLKQIMLLRVQLRTRHECELWYMPYRSCSLRTFLIWTLAGSQTKSWGINALTYGDTYTLYSYTKSLQLWRQVWWRAVSRREDSLFTSKSCSETHRCTHGVFAVFGVTILSVAFHVLIMER